MSELPVQSTSDTSVDLTLPREEAEALLLAVDALRPLLERIRAEIYPAPPEPPALVEEAEEDALRRATRLARESLREARNAIGERRITSEQRRAWQETARRYVTERAGRRIG
jgi:acetyl esterase/lipase